MKTRDSGMPAPGQWESYFDPQAVLSGLGLASPERTIVDVGCGYGTFTRAAAQNGWRRVVAIDIEDLAVRELAARCASEALVAVEVRQRDVVADGIGLDAGEADAVLLFNLLHCEEPLTLLAEADRVLRPGGRVAVIHWRSDIPTPRGPALAIRPSPETCQVWLSAAGFQVAVPATVLPPYHFGLVGRKPVALNGGRRDPDTR